MYKGWAHTDAILEGPLTGDNTLCRDIVAEIIKIFPSWLNKELGEVKGVGERCDSGLLDFPKKKKKQSNGLAVRKQSESNLSIPTMIVDGCVVRNVKNCSNRISECHDTKKKVLSAILKKNANHLISQCVNDKEKEAEQNCEKYEGKNGGKDRGIEKIIFDKMDDCRVNKCFVQIAKWVNPF